jgi:hypothetical protein
MKTIAAQRTGCKEVEAVATIVWLSIYGAQLGTSRPPLVTVAVVPSLHSIAGATPQPGGTSSHNERSIKNSVLVWSAN